MENYQYAVATGNPFDGMKLFGPFIDNDTAIEWAAHKFSHADWWVVTLEEPK